MGYAVDPAEGLSIPKTLEWVDRKLQFESKTAGRVLDRVDALIEVGDVHLVVYLGVLRREITEIGRSTVCQCRERPVEALFCFETRVVERGILVVLFDCSSRSRDV